MRLREIERKSPVGLSEGALRVPGKEEIPAGERVMRLAGSIIEFSCLPHGALHFGYRVGTRTHAIDGAEAIGIGEPAPRCGVIGLQLDRLLEGLLALIYVNSEPVVAAAQVGVVGFGADVARRRRGRGRGFYFFGNDLGKLSRK